MTMDTETRNSVRKNPVNLELLALDKGSAVALVGHPIHVMMVHFPVAFVIATLGIDVVYWWEGGDFWLRAGIWSTGVAFWTGVAASIAGTGELLLVRGIRMLEASWSHAVAAMTLVAELQDFVRFAHPRQLMAYVGMVPGEYSSGTKRRQGSITKAGNSAARRMLVEIAWQSLHGPRVSPIIARRHDQIPAAVTDIAWAAQLRLNAKFKRLLARKVMKTKAVVAVARELTGFVWAIGQQVSTSGWQGVALAEPKAA